MKSLIFAKRNLKEILRDPITLSMGLGFPLVLILLLAAIQKNIPVSLFEIKRLTPGIATFGLSFLTLFTATLISKDRESAFLSRLYTTPLKSFNFLLGYTLPILPIAIGQAAVCFVAAIILGLKITSNILLAILFIIPISLLYISLGLLFGSILGVKAVGGICGTLLTNLAAWLSGTWFDLELVGGVFKDIAYMLPFVHAVEVERAVLLGDFSGIFPSLLYVFGYTAVISALALYFFFRQMKRK